MDAAASSFVDDADRQMSPSRSRTVNAEAHEAALRGRFLLERRTADDLRQALVWFERAISANFAYAHKLYAEYLSYVGRFDEAIAEARQLDPLSIVTNALVGVVLYRARHYDEALAELKRTIEMDPNHPMPYLPQGLAYTMKGMHAEAVAALERGLALTPDSTEMIAQLAHARARGGQRETTRAALEELRARSRQQHVSPFSFALVHVGLGEPQEAIDWLEKAYQGRDWYLCVLKTEPILDPLRPDRRFQDLLRRVNFPTEVKVQSSKFKVEYEAGQASACRAGRPRRAPLKSLCLCGPEDTSPYF
jgi:tetratricopeptide (TPR) repeat protein